MPADVHLEEPVLRLHVALGAATGRRRCRRRPAGCRGRRAAPGPGASGPAGDGRRRSAGTAGGRTTDGGDQQRDDQQQHAAPTSGPARPPAPAAGRGEEELPARGTGRRRGRCGSRAPRSWCSHCAVPLAVAAASANPSPRSPPPTRSRTWRTRAHLPVRLHRVRPRLRAVPELHRRRAHRVPRVRGPAAQGLQRRRRGLQGLRLLPHRQPRSRLVRRPAGRRRRARPTPRRRRPRRQLVRRRLAKPAASSTRRVLRRSNPAGRLLWSGPSTPAPRTAPSVRGMPAPASSGPLATGSAG